MAGATSPALPLASRAASKATAGAEMSRRARIAAILALIGLLVLVWEAAKWIGGDPWRLHGTVLGIRIDYEHFPPLKWRIATDLALPHVWSIVGTFFLPAQRNGPLLAEVLFGNALFTFGEALVGFVFGALLGLGLGIVFANARTVERAFVPYVVASQTVPIVAIAPLVVIFLPIGWLAVAVIAAYLTFFPVTMGALRGLKSADPRAVELMRSYAASPRQVLWKLRLPAALPYLFTAFRIAASASVVGAIIGELPSGIPYGLGSSILNFKQYYVSGPEKLWATIIVAALLGLVFVGLVRLAESLITRGRYRTTGRDPR
jgi:NitT/TauT family transport system permease protein